MYFKIHSIVLSSLKYGDNSLIVKCFTKEFGARTYLLKGILSTTKKRIRPALFQPFTQLEMVVTHRNTGNLEHVREAKIRYLYQSLHTNVYKSSVVMFLSEICSLVCNTEVSEPNFYHFMEEKLCFFDRNEFSPHFHLKFLVDITRFLGFYPDEINDNSFFSIEEGIFTNIDETKHTISGKELQFFKDIILSDYPNLKEIKTNKTERNLLLNHLMRYYQWHLPNFRKIKSLEVLQTIF